MLGFAVVSSDVAAVCALVVLAIAVLDLLCGIAECLLSENPRN